MKSLAPKDYESLPELLPPAAYILVLRDIDADAFRIDSAADPKTALEAVFAESERRFGIELVSILATQDLASSARELEQRHHAKIGSEWLALDPYQIDELRRSSLQIDAYASQYISPVFDTISRGPAQQRPMTRYERLARAYLGGSDEAEGFRRAYARRSEYRRYGRASSQRRRESGAEERRIDWDDPVDAMLQLSARSREFFKSPRGKVVKIVSWTLIIIICFAVSAGR